MPTPTFTIAELITGSQGLLGVEPYIAAGAFFGVSGPLTADAAQSRLAGWLATVVSTPPGPGPAPVPQYAELLSHKDQANGYPGLDSGGALAAARLPVPLPLRVATATAAALQVGITGESLYRFTVDGRGDLLFRDPAFPTNVATLGSDIANEGDGALALFPDGPEKFTCLSGYGGTIARDGSGVGPYWFLDNNSTSAFVNLQLGRWGFAAGQANLKVVTNGTTPAFAFLGLDADLAIASDTPALLISRDGNSTPVFQFRYDGTIAWGTALDTTLKRVGAGQLEANGGIGMFGVAPPAARPATPVTLANVIALLQSYGMCV